MKIAYDTKLMRPGCALIQAAMGGAPNEVVMKFPLQSWIEGVTPDMGLIEVTSEQLEKLIKMTEEHCVESS